MVVKEKTCKQGGWVGHINKQEWRFRTGMTAYKQQKDVMMSCMWPTRKFYWDLAAEFCLAVITVKLI